MINQYESLLIFSEYLHIDVYERALEANKGFYLDNNILINSTLNTSEKYCILSEELGHHFKTYGNILDQSDISNKKQELIARRWSHNFITPIDSIVSAYENGYKSIYEIADYLGVTLEYLYECLNDYKAMYGTSYENDKYYISFEPTLTISAKDKTIS